MLVQLFNHPKRTWKWPIFLLAVASEKWLSHRKFHDDVKRWLRSFVHHGNLVPPQHISALHTWWPVTTCQRIVWSPRRSCHQRTHSSRLLNEPQSDLQLEQFFPSTLTLWQSNIAMENHICLIGKSSINYEWVIFHGYVKLPQANPY